MISPFIYTKYAVLSNYHLKELWELWWQVSMRFGLTVRRGNSLCDSTRYFSVSDLLFPQLMNA
jgi:hypothetical protein